MPDARYPRIARVNELVREVLAEEVERLSDPRLGFVTITGVDVTGDLRHATVYFSVLGRNDETVGSAAAGLTAAAAHLKAALARQARLKYTPDLEFREDPAVRRGERVEEILRLLHEKDR